MRWTYFPLLWHLPFSCSCYKELCHPIHFFWDIFSLFFHDSLLTSYFISCFTRVCMHFQNSRKMLHWMLSRFFQEHNNLGIQWGCSLGAIYTWYTFDQSLFIWYVCWSPGARVYFNACACGHACNLFVTFCKLWCATQELKRYLVPLCEMIVYE